MTTDCIDNIQFSTEAADRLHDAVLGIVVAVVLVIPAALAALTLF